MDATYPESFWDTLNQEPYDFYERVRAEGEVVWDAAMKAWLVVSARAARQVLEDDALFLHPVLTMQAGGTYMAIRGNNPRSFFFLQGEKHHQMHRWWVRDLLSPRWVQQYKPSAVDPAINRLLESLQSRTRFDAFRDYAEMLPINVFTRLLGLPEDEDFLLRIKRLNDDIAAFASLAHSLKLETNPSEESKAIAERAVGAARELDELLLPVVEERRGGSGDDMISQLWAGGPSIFPDWDSTDTLDGCRRLLFAGVDTTTHTAANAIYLLLKHPEIAEQIRTDVEKVAERFIEEVLRLEGSVQFRPRRVTGDTEVAGTPVKKGDMLVVILMAANRDPSQFTCPHAVDLERPMGGRNHLAFLAGVRSCPGATLARAELVAAVRALFKAWPAIRLDQDAEPPSFRGFMFRSHHPLNVRVD